MSKIKQISLFMAFVAVLVICGLMGFSNNFVNASALENEIVETADNVGLEAFEEIEHEQETVSIMATSSNDDFKKETDAVIPADTVGFSNRKLIPNHDYYRARPNHGLNNSSGISGTCGEVAAQLTLSYHNFYSDRRIIENEFLLGGNDPNNEFERNQIQVMILFIGR